MIRRAERKKTQVCSDQEYTVVFDRLSRMPDNVEHLVVQIGELPDLLCGTATAAVLRYPVQVSLLPTHAWSF